MQTTWALKNEKSSALPTAALARPWAGLVWRALPRSACWARSGGGRGARDQSPAVRWSKRRPNSTPRLNLFQELNPGQRISLLFYPAIIISNVYAKSNCVFGFMANIWTVLQFEKSKYFGPKRHLFFLCLLDLFPGEASRPSDGKPNS